MSRSSSKPSSIEHARAVRETCLAHIKRLERGEESLRDSLLRPPDYLLGVDIWDLLKAPVGMGPATARRVCERSHVWPHTPVGDCSPPQIRRLIDALPERVK